MVKIRKFSAKKGSKDAKKALKEEGKKIKENAKKVQEEKRFELNSKELRVNLDQLQKDIKKAYSSMTRILPESVKDAEIKRFGNAAHIILPKEYAGKKATVLIKK